MRVFFESWLKFCAVSAFRNLGIFWINFWLGGGPGGSLLVFWGWENGVCQSRRFMYDLSGSRMT